MSPKLKSNQAAPKVQQNATACPAEQYPQLSFRYMTTNSAHSLKYLEKLKNAERIKTLDGLFQRFEELTKMSWERLMLLKKTEGCETLTWNRIKFRGTNASTEEGKALVFRFDTWQGNGKGRIIGFKDSPCSAFFIVGFDFDFTAYDHDT